MKRVERLRHDLKEARTLIAQSRNASIDNDYVRTKLEEAYSIIEKVRSELSFGIIAKGEK